MAKSFFDQARDLLTSAYTRGSKFVAKSPISVAPNSFIAQTATKFIPSVAQSFYNSAGPGNLVKAANQGLNYLTQRSSPQVMSTQINRNLDLAQNLRNQGNVKGADFLLRKTYPQAQQMGQQVRQLTSIGNQARTQAALGVGKIALTLSGAKFVNPVSLGVAELFGAGMSKLTGGNPYESAGQAIGQTPSVLGLSRFTGPIGSALTSKFGSVAQQTLGRTFTGAVNLAENEVLSRLDEKVPGISDRLMSFGLGALMSGKANDQVAGKFIKEYETKVPPEVKKQINDLVRTITGNFRIKVSVFDPVSGKNVKVPMWQYKMFGANAYKLNAKMSVPDGEVKDVTKGRLSDVSGGMKLYTGQRKDWVPKLPEGDNVDSLMYGKGIYLTPDKSIAEGYARGGGKLHEVMADIKNPLTPKMKDWQQFIQKSNAEQKRQYLINHGYDAVVDTSGKYKQVMVVNPEQIKLPQSQVLGKEGQLTLKIKSEVPSQSNYTTKGNNIAQPPVSSGRLGDVPKTVRVWNKSKFSNKGAYADIPVIRKEENITLYQGSNPGENRQFWTPDKKYAEQFGKVKEKTGTFYKVDNGNRMTDVYIEAKPNVAQPPVSDIPSTGGEINPLLKEAKKRGYNDKNVEANLWNVKQELEDEMMRAKKTMIEVGNKYINKKIALKDNINSPEELMTPQDRKIYQDANNLFDKNIKLLRGSSGEIGKGGVPLNIKNQTKFVPSKTEKNLGMEGQARGVALNQNAGVLGQSTSFGKSIEKIAPAKSIGKTTPTLGKVQEPPIQRPTDTAAIGSTTANQIKTNPSRVSIPEATPETNSYLDELIQNQNNARNKESKVGAISKLYNEIKTKLVDSTAPIEDALSAAEKRGKFQVLPKDDVRLQIDRVLRSPTLAGQFAKDNGLIDVIKSAPNLDALDQYMIAKHARTIEASGRKTGRDLARDQQLINELQGTYEPFAQKVTAYSRKLLDYATETGLISKELSASLKAQYPDYVPLQRIMDEADKVSFGTGKGVASQGSQGVVKKLVGSERQIDSPVASLLEKTQTAFQQGERNIAARQLSLYKDLPGFEGLIREIDGNSTGKHTISFMDNGKKRVLEVTPEIESAAKSLNREQLGFLGKIFSVPTRILRLGATGLNLPFTAANVAKDQLTGFINSNRAASTSFANPKNFLRALFSAAKHDGLYDELVRAGAGGTSYDIGRDATRLTIKQIRAGRTPIGKAMWTATHPGEIITAIENLIGRSEEVGRLQQYGGTKQALLNEGRTAQDASLLAAKAARENTANFARSGDWGKVLNALMPYFNAGIQGARATVEALGERPKETSAKIAIGLFMPVAAATAYNLSDPERRKVYEDIDDYEKENNIILVLDPSKGLENGRYGGVLKIPIQQGFGQLAIGVRQGIEQAYGSSQASFKDIAAGLLGFATSVNTGSPRELFSSLTPQALKVPIETMTNTNLFTGKQIVPQYMKNKPPEEQAYPFTSGTTRILGRALNTSPLYVQNAFNTSLGGVGRQMLNASDTILNKAGVIPSYQVGGESPLAATEKRFGSASGGKILEKAYQDKDRSDAAKRKAIEYYLSGKIDDAKKLKEQYGFSVKQEDLKRTKTNQTKKAAEMYIEGKVEAAKELKKQYGLSVTNDDVVKAAKRKAIELYKLGLVDEAKALKQKYGFSVKQEEVN